ncbi:MULTISPECIES: argininosuccinate lyase [unclassified Prochlorococcus]|uniref:argininosuccinate lyase n=1 Tax=unclassified Prochlorococcus TaxID=2627481 RepID=UPI0005339AF8|nr:MULTISPECIES: argininosuccinate lyase [unclassified Prochlorococcus]KGG14471.1 Argininosuccinate lyase [Prochlorococcus sp. MIT 0602]KGG16090.1 Argininosuccinate lyase [Prochlorococcus sp. MIT 0603]
MVKTWSQRFEEGLNPFIETFNASIAFDFVLLEEDLDGSIAHARMLGKVGLITSAEAAQLEDGLEKIRFEASQGNFKPDDLDEDVHMAVERRLTSLLGSLGKKLHTARSRNDQVGTDLRLWLRRRIDELDIQLKRLQIALFNQAEQNIFTLIPGYTHLQRAQPLSLAHHLLAYIEMIQRDRNRLLDVRKRVNICPLGAAALAGTSLSIDRRSTAEQLGFSSIYANSLDAVSDRDFAVEFTSASSLIMVHLSRLAEEIILWASEEFSFIYLTDRCSTGSSLMPQKKNPDVPELVRGKTGRVFGHLQALLTMIKGLPLAYNKDFQEDKEAIFDTFTTVFDSLKAMSILLEEGLEFSYESLSKAVEADFSNATDVADYLVSKNIPFREAYQIVGNLVKFCIKDKILLKDLTIAQWQEIHPVFDEDIYEKIIPQNVVASRVSEGGTGFERVRQELQKWKNDLISPNQ